MLAVLVVYSRSVVVRRREPSTSTGRVLLLDELKQELDGTNKGEAAGVREALPLGPGGEVGRRLAAEITPGPPNRGPSRRQFVVMDLGDVHDDELAPALAGELRGEAGGAVAVGLRSVASTTGPSSPAGSTPAAR